MAKSVNKQKNEILITIGDYSVKCRMSFSAIVEIEDLCDKTVFEIGTLVDQKKLSASKLIDIIEIASVDEIKREDIESAVEDFGIAQLENGVFMLMLSSFVGGENLKKVEEKKSQ